MAWAYRKPLTINSSLTPGALTDFPIYISISSDSDLSAKAQADGDDIAFFDSDETTQLDHEIESYSSGTLIAHVRKPSLAATGNPVIYMYYGDAALGSQQDVSGVWNPIFEGVWHLRESPAGGAPQHTDYSSKGRHGTATGMVAGNLIAGAIGTGGIDFNGADRRIVIPNDTELHFTGGQTVSAWIRSDTHTDIRHIVGTGNSTDTAGWRLYVRNNSQIEFNQARTTGDRRFQNNGITLTDGTWYYVACTFNSSTPDTLGTVYVNANTSTASNDTGSGTSVQGTSGLYIGVAQNLGHEFDGVIDEVRLSTATRSTNWLATEYNNQSNPGSFITVGSEESLGSAVGAASYYYRQLA